MLVLHCAAVRKKTIVVTVSLSSQNVNREQNDEALHKSGRMEPTTIKNIHEAHNESKRKEHTEGRRMMTRLFQQTE